MGQRYITNFLSATLTRVAKDDSDEDDKDPSEDEGDIGTLALDGQRLEQILKSAMRRADQDRGDGPRT